VKNRILTDFICKTEILLLHVCLPQNFALFLLPSPKNWIRLYQAVNFFNFHRFKAIAEKLEYLLLDNKIDRNKMLSYRRETALQGAL